MKNGNPVNLLRRKKKKDLFSPPVCELLHPWSEHDFPANWLSVGVV
jgi:hypothetical protein